MTGSRPQQPVPFTAGCLPPVAGTCGCPCHANEHVRHLVACCCPHRRVAGCLECDPLAGAASDDTPDDTPGGGDAVG